MIRDGWHLQDDRARLLTGAYISDSGAAANMSEQCRRVVPHMEMSFGHVLFHQWSRNRNDYWGRSLNQGRGVHAFLASEGIGCSSTRGSPA